MTRSMKLGKFLPIAVILGTSISQQAFAQDGATSTNFSGPFASIASSLADKGVTFNATTFDFFESNPSFGIDPGYAANSTYWVTGVDLDLHKLVGLPGSTIHFKESFFTFVYNNNNIGSEFGDNSIGFYTTYNPVPDQLTQLTYELSLMGGKLDIEFGRTHPFFYFAPMTCSTYDTCFNDILYFDSGYISPFYSVWGGRAKYNLTPSSYIQVGAFSNDDDPHHYTGWEWTRQIPSGVLSMAEYGINTGQSGKYPGLYTITGYYNSGAHDDVYWTANHLPRGYNPQASPEMVYGTSGLVFNSQQLIWRQDGGDSIAPSPRTLTFYAGAGVSFDPTQPVQSDVYAGLTLQAPLLSRPHDQLGMKIRWEHMSDEYTAFAPEANAYGGGSGAPFPQDKAIFELSANIDVGEGVMFQPVTDYIINPTSYFNPYSAVRPRDGFYVGAALMVPLGQLAGLQSR